MLMFISESHAQENARRYFYRPQTKFAKVMFLHLSVSHSVHGGCAWAGGMHGGGGRHAWWGACMLGVCGRGHVWWGACVAGGPGMTGSMWGMVGCMCGGGVHGSGHAWWGHAWQGACMAQGHAWHGGMHGRVGVHGRGACVVGACMAWQGVCVVGDVHATHTPPNTMRYGRSMHGRYASYWNAFLFLLQFCTLGERLSCLESSPLSYANIKIALFCRIFN